MQTPPGEGAIATFILDGDQCLALLGKVLRTKQPLHPFEKGRLILGRLTDAAGRLVDEVVVAPLDPKESPSALERVELSSHGGVGVTAAVVRVLEEAGFRPAWEGELEARAHRAGRRSLPTLEARFRLTRDLTARQTSFILGHTMLQERWERIGMHAALGARQRLDGWREELRPHVEKELAQAPAGLALARTQRVVVAGPVNVGKSTLVNALLRSEQSIVSDQPGTTRDHLVRPAHLRGLSLLLSDTAGLRVLTESSPANEVEAEGQARARSAAADADLVLYLIDGSSAPGSALCDEVEALNKALQTNGRKGRLVLVLNKSDQGSDPEAAGLGFALGAPSVAVSALTGSGVGDLEAEIERQLLGEPEPEPGAVFTLRQLRCLEALRDSLEQSLDAVELIGHIRDLVGTRPNEEELAAVFREAAEEC